MSSQPCAPDGPSQCDREFLHRMALYYRYLGRPDVPFPYVHYDPDDEHVDAYETDSEVHAENHPGNHSGTDSTDSTDSGPEVAHAHFLDGYVYTIGEDGVIHGDEPESPPEEEEDHIVIEEVHDHDNLVDVPPEGVDSEQSTALPEDTDRPGYIGEFSDSSVSSEDWGSISSEDWELAASEYFGPNVANGKSGLWIWGACCCKRRRLS